MQGIAFVPRELEVMSRDKLMNGMIFTIRKTKNSNAYAKLDATRHIIARASPDITDEVYRLRGAIVSMVSCFDEHLLLRGASFLFG